MWANWKHLRRAVAVIAGLVVALAAVAWLAVTLVQNAREVARVSQQLADEQVKEQEAEAARVEADSGAEAAVAAARGDAAAADRRREAARAEELARRQETEQALAVAIADLREIETAGNQLLGDLERAETKNERLTKERAQVQTVVNEFRDVIEERDAERQQLYGLGLRVAVAQARSNYLNPFVFIQGGTFLMGSPDDVGDSNEHPQHPVELSSFYIQQYEVTNEEFRLFDPKHDFDADEGRHPVANVSWEQAAAYAAWLGGSLPTEAQWEFTARGAEGREYPWGPGPPRAGTHGNWVSSHTVPVGSFPEGATPLGVHDIAGNVWEWCSDRYGEYPTDAPKDYVGPNEGDLRVLRGGSFLDAEDDLRSAFRNRNFPRGRLGSVGFRVVVSPFSSD